MARTYRKMPVWDYPDPEHEEIVEQLLTNGQRQLRSTYNKQGYYNRRSRDGSKAWYTIPSDFKRERRRYRRQKVKQHIRDARYNPDMYDTIPKFRREDAWLFW